MLLVAGFHGSGMGVWANILSIPTGLFARNHADLVLRANIRRDQRRLFARIPFNNRFNGVRLRSGVFWANNDLVFAIMFAHWTL